MCACTHTHTYTLPVCLNPSFSTTVRRPGCFRLSVCHRPGSACLLASSVFVCLLVCLLVGLCGVYVGRFTVLAKYELEASNTSAIVATITDLLNGTMKGWLHLHTGIEACLERTYRCQDGCTRRIRTASCSVLWWDNRLRKWVSLPTISVHQLGRIDLQRRLQANGIHQSPRKGLEYEISVRELGVAAQLCKKLVESQLPETQSEEKHTKNVLDLFFLAPRLPSLVWIFTFSLLIVSYTSTVKMEHRLFLDVVV